MKSSTSKMSWLRKTVMMSVVFAMGSIAAFAQTKTVSGTIVDDFGDPVLGANVVIVGTTTGVTTDLDGNFTLTGVPENAQLKVTFIGYATQTVPVAGQSKINVTLKEDVAQLEDVVVVGYGVMKKSDLTGSVSSIGTEKLVAKGAPSVLENLQGSTPGVNITLSGGRTNGSPAIEIRGKSSINSSVSPLYVVDGVTCSDIDWLNPQDIDRIDVLKDASSTAIYGSRATAGVIMVTTKSGSTVKKSEKATISYDGYYGWSKIARMPDFMSGEQFYNYRFKKFLTYANSDATISPLDPSSPIYQISGAVLEQCLLREEVGSGNYKMKDMLAAGNTYDWPDLVTQDGSQQNHYLAISGSSEKTNYHMGVGFNQNEGVYAGDKKSQLTFKGSADAKVNSILSAGFSMNISRTENDYANDNGINQAFRMNPYMVPYNENGELNHKPGAYTSLGTCSSYQFSDQVNPLDLLKNEKKNRETWRTVGNFYAQLEPIKGLTFKTNFAPSFNYYRVGYYTGYTNPVTGSHYDDSESNTSTLETKRSFSWTWDNTINYNTTIAKNHNINVMGLFSSQKSNSEYIKNAYTDVIEGTDWWNQNAGGSTFNQEGSSNSYTESSMLSWAFRVNYNWKHRYFVTATSRWDGASRFGKDNRWGSFPSAALAWSISEEDFMAETKDWLENLKFRVSYGITGNCAGIGDFATLQSLSGTNYYYYMGQWLTGSKASDVVDKTLQWEKSKEYNIGLDYTLFGGRITGTVDFYNKESQDLLYGVELPLEAGGSSMTTNVGSVRNKGVELSLTTVNIEKSDWRWTTTFTFAHNNNEVLEINGISDELINSGVASSLFVGKSVNNLYTYEMGGIVSNKLMTVPNNDAAKNAGLTPGDKMTENAYYYKVYGLTEGQPYVVDQNGDGQITADDQKVFTQDPKFTASLTSTLTYKQWDFGFNLYARYGGKAYSNFYSEYMNWSDRGRQKLNCDFYIPAGALIDCDGVNPDGTYINPVYQKSTHYGDTPFPNNGGLNGGVGLQASYYNSAKCVVDPSFLKVKNITLGYTFDKKLLKPWHCSYLRLYATVTNPFCWTEYKGFDPEWAGATLKNDGPSTVNYQIGASIKF